MLLYFHVNVDSNVESLQSAETGNYKWLGKWDMPDKTARKLLPDLWWRAVAVTSEEICPVTKGWHTEDLPLGFLQINPFSAKQSLLSQ